MPNAVKKIRVAHFIGSLQIGGAENQVAMLLGELDPTLCELHLITLTQADSGFEGALPGYVQTHCIHYRRRWAPLGIYKLYSILKKNRIDVLHCHMYHASIKGAVVGKLASVPVVLTSEHGKDTWKTPLHDFIERTIISPSTACRVAVSEDIRQLRIQAGIPASSIITIPNAVNTEVRVADNSGRPKKLGTLGRLIDVKDHRVLINAVKLLRDEGVDITLRIAGEGEERDNLQRQITELDLQKIVELVGNQDANKFLAGIDVFVMSSKFEGLPVALLEAMAHGLPIVATRVGGIPEVIHHQHEGLLCSAGDPSALADSIKTLIEDAGIRVELGSQARNKVVRDYGMDGVIGQWHKLYGCLLNRECDQ